MKEVSTLYCYIGHSNLDPPHLLIYGGITSQLATQACFMKKQYILNTWPIVQWFIMAVKSKAYISIMEFTCGIFSLPKWVAYLNKCDVLAIMHYFKTQWCYTV